MLTIGTIYTILTRHRGVAQFGRAPCSGRGGRKFESCRLDSVFENRRYALWLVGQGVKTPPSHGGNMGSIPVRAAF